MKNQQFVSGVLSELLVLAIEYRKESKFLDGQPEGAKAEGFAEGIEATCAWFSKARQAQGDNKAKLMNVLQKTIEEKRAAVAKLKRGNKEGGDIL